MAFTETDIAYLGTQRLGRLATAKPDCRLQVSPVGFGYNPDLGTIDIGGWKMAESQKFRNVADNGKVAFVVDDIASVDPWIVRGIEIRGHAEALLTPTDSASPVAPGSPIIRIHPHRIIRWGLD
jgi:pyridoxamine 5'-phosphate oxidase family protein